MNKFISISLLSATLATSAFAAGHTGNVGINVSLDNTLGIQGEFNLEKSISLQAFLKNHSSYYYSNYFGNYSYTAFGVAGLYDFSKEIRFTNHKVHPYAGLGLYAINAALNGPGGVSPSPTNGGLYLTVGARYEFSPEFDFDGNYNNIGGLTAGANFKF